MIGIPLGLFYANLVESLFHKHVLHGFGKHPKSFWSFHWIEHHNVARRHGFRDEHYRTRPFFGWHPQTKERLAIATGVALHLPLLPVAPLFVGTLACCGVWFYRRHARGHLDPEWAREHLRCHYDHHMGPDPDCNWGIGLDWYDRLTGSRVPYAGTEAERAALARKAARVAAASGGER